MRRSPLITGTAALAAGLLAASVAAPALAEARKGPRLGDWSCVAGEATSTLTLSKGNRYAVDGADRAKYVFKAGHNTLKFKSGDYAGVLSGSYDRATGTLSLVSLEDGSTFGTCTRAADVPVPASTPEPEPVTEG